MHSLCSTGCVVLLLFPQLPPQRLWLNRYFCMPLLLLACAAAATAFMYMLSLLHNRALANQAHADTLVRTLGAPCSACQDDVRFLKLLCDTPPFRLLAA